MGLTVWAFWNGGTMETTLFRQPKGVFKCISPTYGRIEKFRQPKGRLGSNRSRIRYANLRVTWDVFNDWDGNAHWRIMFRIRAALLILPTAWQMFVFVNRLQDVLCCVTATEAYWNILRHHWAVFGVLFHPGWANHNTLQHHSAESV